MIFTKKELATIAILAMKGINKEVEEIEALVKLVDRFSEAVLEGKLEVGGE